MCPSFVRCYLLATRTASALGLATMLGVPAAHAYAADYPSRPVTMIVPHAAGGSTDAQARWIAKGLAERLGKPVVIDNRAGAGGRIAASVAARAAPDGHTLFFGTLSMLVIEPALRTNVGYDPQRDFAPITLIAEAPFVLVVPSSLPIRSISDLVAYARKPAVNLTYASPGPGTAAHLLGEMLKAAAHIQIIPVPYKGAAPALIDLVGGQVSMFFTTFQTAGSQIRAGKQIARQVLRNPFYIGVMGSIHMTVMRGFFLRNL